MSKENFKMAKELVDSYEARIKVIREVAEDTRELLEDFRAKREKMSKELKGALAEHESLRKKDFDQWMRDILTTQKNREEKVKEMLANFQDQEAVVVDNLKRMLEKGEELRLKDFKKTLAKIKKEQESREEQSTNDIHQEISEMQAEVKEMLEDFKKEREEAASEWQNMTAAMTERRGSSNQSDSQGRSSGKSYKKT